MKVSTLIVALATLISTSAYGGPWATGVQIGGGGTFGTVTFHASDVTVNTTIDEDDDAVNCFAYDMVQQAEGGNVFLGYGFCWCDRFRFTPQFDAYFLGSNARHCYAYGDIEDNFLSRVRCDTILDLSIKPGVIVADCLLFEMKAGVSWAHVRQDMRWVNDDPPFQVQDSRVSNNWPTGYTLGAAARIGLTRCLTGFFAFDWHGYWSGPSAQVFDLPVGPAGPDSWKSSISHLHAKTFSFGLSWSW